MNTEAETIERLNARSQAALRWARELEKKDHIDANALNEMLLAFQINDFLESVDLKAIQDSSTRSTKEYMEVARTILEQSAERTKRLKLELELKMYRDQVADQKRKLREALSKGGATKGLSPETLGEIEAAMSQM
jgi:hypothetical protein